MVTAGASVGLAFPGLGFAQQSTAAVPDLVAVRGGQPDGMFDRGIAAFGGMRRFVAPGDTVVIKPNMSWNVDPERGATTDPKLVQRIIEHCVDARARRVYLVDHTLDNARLAFGRNGMNDAADSGGGSIVPANSSRYYQEVEIGGAQNLTTVRVHELVLEADVLINVPILKHHGSARITSALKNLMGLVWNRRYYHSHGLNQCIADFPLVRTPDLNVVDAYRVMMSGGPRGSSYAAKLELKRMQIISPDIVATDVASAKTWGIEPNRVPYIAMAGEHGLGVYDLDSLAIERISV
jgi:uncharacterized protein (DUF362 family)